MSNPLQQLTHLGQSIWYDFITRDLIASGELKRLIDTQELRGMTSNPTIFEKAVAASGDYDQEIREFASRGESPDAIVESIMVKDVQAACDVFRPVYDRTDKVDGMVSIEVPPSVASDTEGSITIAERLWRKVDRPNVMIKIPGTDAGVPAIRECLTRGININITLLFSIDRYQQVIDTYFDALEARVAAKQPIDTLRSVASFFVSRVDGQTDAEIKKAGDRGKDVLHKMAIANARVAYQVFGESLMTPRWQALAARGARAQRPLWASTSTKDPSLPDTYYVDALIAPDTVNTIPPETFKAFADHGSAEVRITPATERESVKMLRAYENLGVSPLAERTAFLEVDGIKKFTDSWNALVGQVESKAKALAA